VFYFLIIVPVIALLLLGMNFLFAVNKPTIDKIGPFECGFQSFSQTRSPFSIQFYIVGLLFLIFDLEILFIYPFVSSIALNNIYSFSIFLLFIFILIPGFIYEFGTGALKISPSYSPHSPMTSSSSSSSSTPMTSTSMTYSYKGSDLKEKSIIMTSLWCSAIMTLYLWDEPLSSILNILFFLFLPEFDL
jgi:NADH:ubiquinone oxidoreductase subunit 3 (subunit A)